MAKTAALPAAVDQLYKILQSLQDRAERQRALTAALVMLGEAIPPFDTQAGGGGPAGRGSGEGAKGDAAAAAGGELSARQFFDLKQPKNKVEELAVAARYREKYLGATSHTKDEFASVISQAKRNFDRTNFNRDLGNAKTAGLLAKGPNNTTTHSGEAYVDALPDRQAAKSTRRSSRVSRKKKKSKAKP